MDVVPHHELVEREQSQHRFFHHIPFLLFYDRPAEISKDQFYIHTAFIFRQFFQDIKTDAEILFQQFYQRDIQDNILITFPDDIIVAALTDDVHGQQQDGGIAGLLTFGCLIPFQHTQS